MTCEVVADDGAVCRREAHADDPDAHEFRQPSTHPVDGGRRWSDWMRMVNEVRRALIGFSVVDAHTPSSAKLTEIAGLVGLRMIGQEDGTVTYGGEFSTPVSTTPEKGKA